MAYKIITILTEGDHDSAFIYRILKANGIVTDNRIIKKYPAPLTELLKYDISNISIEDLNIQDAGTRFLPVRAMTQGNNTILIYSMRGDSQTSKRTNLIRTINAFNVQDPDSLEAVADTTFTALYFLDADNQGVEARLLEVKKELESALKTGKLPGEFIAGKLYPFENIQVGVYVFAEPEKNTGMLEDVLIPLMKDGNIDIFEAADTFLNVIESSVLFGDKLIKDKNGAIIKVNAQKFSYKKSLVGTVGQLQKSGKSNTTCITDTDYLTTVKINNNLTCRTIFNFIQQTMIK